MAPRFEALTNVRQNARPHDFVGEHLARNGVRNPYRFVSSTVKVFIVGIYHFCRCWQGRIRPAPPNFFKLFYGRGRYSMRSAQSNPPPHATDPPAGAPACHTRWQDTERRNRMTPACPNPSRVNSPACMGILARSKPTRIIFDSRKVSAGRDLSPDRYAPSRQSEMWTRGKPESILAGQGRHQPVDVFSSASRSRLHMAASLTLFAPSRFANILALRSDRRYQRRVQRK